MKLSWTTRDSSDRLSVSPIEDRYREGTRIIYGLYAAAITAGIAGVGLALTGDADIGIPVLVTVAFLLIMIFRVKRRYVDPLRDLGESP
jgi:hypothetical protein